MNHDPQLGTCPKCHSRIADGVCEGCGLIVQSQLPGPQRVGIVERIPEERSTPSLPSDKAFTLHCRCGSDFKPECPDCGTLYAETYPSGSTPSPDPPPQRPYNDKWWDNHAELGKWTANLQAEVERLREALRLYGGHLETCMDFATRTEKQCSCGWIQLWAALAPSLPTKEISSTNATNSKENMNNG